MNFTRSLPLIGEDGLARLAACRVTVVGLGGVGGYVVEVLARSGVGALTLIVGINADGTVAGAQVTSHGETPGLGAKAQSDAAWVGQYAGQPADGSLAVTKDGGTINAITGATITSRAVTLGVNTAANCVASLG